MLIKLIAKALQLKQSIKRHHRGDEWTMPPVINQPWFGGWPRCPRRTRLLLSGFLLLGILALGRDLAGPQLGLTFLAVTG